MFRVLTGRLDQRSWQTDDRTLRSKVEIMAEDIGVSLRFATVDTQKVIRPQVKDESEEAPHTI